MPRVTPLELDPRWDMNELENERMNDDVSRFTSPELRSVTRLHGQMNVGYNFPIEPTTAAVKPDSVQ